MIGKCSIKSEKVICSEKFDNDNYFLSFLFGAAGFKLHDIHHHNPGTLFNLSSIKIAIKLKKVKESI